MEKIFYNTKLKKLLISVLVVTLLMTYIMPNVVLAVTIEKTLENGEKKQLEVEDSDGKVKTFTVQGYKLNDVTGTWESGTIYYYIAAGSVQEMMDSATNTTYSNSIAQGFGDRVAEVVTIDDVKASVKKEIINQVESNKFENINEEIVEDDVSLERICVKYKDQSDKILVIGEVQSSAGQYTPPEGLVQYSKEAGVKFTATVNITEEEINEAINDETLGELDANDNEDPDPDVSGSDLGGILLSPFFYLINFVVDSITETVGTIMLSEGLSLDGVWGGDILTVAKEEIPDGEEIDYKVNINSFLLGSYQYPNIKYTPEKIFSGTVELLSIDFITGKTSDGQQITNEGWNGIRKVISSWYKVLRMIAIIGLLSVLIYMGIKIIISANAKEKAKYKQWIIDWFIAVAILFAMHFIMAFIVSVTGEFSNLLGETTGTINVGVVNNEGGPVIDSFTTNLMGLVRFMIQSENFAIKVGYEVMYIMLLVYTIKFTFVYLKRVLNMAFLTLIAPIVALMYPLDKINDGNAQSFNMWLKDYIFNALLQPMHLILYYVLLGSAVGVAAANPIYGIVVLTFLSEAERLLKKFFGFDKAGGGTVGGMAGAFAAGAIASNIKNIAKFGAGGSSGVGSGSDKNEALNSPKPTEPTGMNSFETADNAIFGNNENGDGGNSIPDGGSGNNTPATNPLVTNPPATNPPATNPPATNPPVTNPLVTNPPVTNPLATNPTATNLTATNQPADKGVSVRQMASRTGKGLKAVGKKLVKPMWDTDKSLRYNATRWGRRLVGAGVGVTAAAIQAGISLTDGRYNPMEGFATMTAGYAGGKQIHKGVEGIWDTYQDGANAGTDATSKDAQMKRAQARFRDRDDVIAFNKKNYPGKEREAMQRQTDHYLTAGISDLKEMKQGMKYADKLVGKTDGLTNEQIRERKKEADRRAAATLEFRSALQSQGQLGVVYDKKKREKYIKEASGGDAKLAKQYENAFNSLIAFNEANA